ncbi:MAG: quinolinate synthase NadA, partial [Paludibacteraceae bacterium]|nr:quinolinate synthase NadA [Paludibacteraceae bacterium]
YINAVTGRNMILWNGCCHVHSQFSIEKLKELKAEYPEAEVLAHPECKKELLDLADFIGSTAALLSYSGKSEKTQFIVATESGILHQMKKDYPEKTFIPVPPETGNCACNECNYMRMNTMEKLYNCLKNETPEIIVDKEVAEKAVKPIIKMLEMSK